jgi:hypothetical protein
MKTRLLEATLPSTRVILVSLTNVVSLNQFYGPENSPIPVFTKPTRPAFQGNCSSQLTLSSDEFAVVAWNGQSCGAYTSIAASSLSFAGAAT